MSVRLEPLQTIAHSDTGRRRCNRSALPIAAVVIGLALSAAAALAQGQSSPSFPPPSDFLDGQPVASSADVVGAPLPPPRPTRTTPAKRTDRLAAETKPARGGTNLAYAPVASPGSLHGDSGPCRRPRIVIDDYWRGGPIIDCRGDFRPR